MTTQISRDNIQAATLGGFGGPKISLVQVTNSSYTNIDDTAVDLTGGFVKIIGSGFAAGCQVLVGLTPATSVTFISETEVRAQLPATAAGSYIVYLVNSDGGTAIRVNGVTFSGTPTWLSAGTLGGEADSLISIQLAATSATTFALAAGSTLPPGVSLSSSGLLSGTITGITQETVYNFTINAVDAELQDSPRAFAFTVTSGDVLFPLTTLLLPGTANTFVRDSSINNATATVFGDTRPSRFNPHLTGWSNFFDGTGDHLTLNSITTSGDFTLEFWAYRTAAVSSFMIPFSAGGNNGWVGWMTNATTFVWDSVVTATVPDTINTWAHYAVVRQGTTARIYVNGVQCGSASTSANLTFSTIGMFGTGSLNYTGYLSNVRLVNGTALYTAAFTPPTQPLTAISGTSLLTCQSNRFRDASTSNLTITRTGDVAVDSFSPFVEPATTGGSAYFDGTGDYVTMPANNFSTGSNAWTIEGWCYFTNSSRNDVLVNGLANNRLYVVWLGTTLYLGDGTTNNLVITNAKPINTWFHVAVVKNGSTYTAYINGTSVGFTNNPLTSATLTTWEVGAWTSQGNLALGYISNLRVTATAVYTDAFTPPTQPLTAVAGTNILTLQTHQPHNNSQFLDSSTENFLITRSGNTTQGSFSPYSPSGWSNFFDGSGDSIRKGGSGVLTASGDVTIECWIYPLSSTVIGLFDGGPGQGGILRNFPANTIAKVGESGAVFTVTPNQWQHFACTFANGNIRVFINGSLNASGTYSSGYGEGSNFDIGTINTGGDGAFNGYISNFRVTRSVLYTTTFTPSTTPLTAIAGTSLLTCCDNRFIDDSPNNFALTRNGDVRVTNFSPFRAVTQTPQTHSVFFDGTGDYLSVPGNTAFAMGTGDFTLEAWIYPTSAPTYWPIISQFSSLSTGGGFYFFSLNSSGQIELYYDGQTYAGLTATAATLNTWNHVTVARQGSTIRGFINGVLAGTITYSGIFGNSSTNLEIGGSTRSGGNWWANGYISNARIIKGTALYTAAFTPPTQPLTAVSGTSLLTCQNATFVDNSSNRFAVTGFGNSQPSMVNPFGFTFANTSGYSAAAHGGSIYFDGSGDNLTTPAAAQLLFGTSDFTIEFCVYHNSVADNVYVGDISQASGAGSWALSSLGGFEGTRKLYFTAGSLDLTVSAPITIVPGMWYHIAVTRSGSSVRLFVNGTQLGATFSFSRNITTGSGSIAIGSTTNNQWFLNGYISNLRLVRGQALYTGNFVPPLAPVQPVPNTVLLLNGTGAAVTDATTKNVVETVGTVAISTAVSKFGGSSTNFPSTESWLKLPNSDTGVFGTGNFTVEMWVFFPVELASSGRLIAFTSSATATAGRLQQAAGNGLQWTNADNLGGFGTGANIPVSLNTWTHVAVCRSGTTLRYFKDGVQVASGSDTSNYTVRSISVGSDHDGNWRLQCNIQDLRITKTARYTGNFTPPTTAFLTK